MFEQIKASRARVKWNLREVHKVTQWKGGCIYKTKSLGYIVCSPEYRLLGKPEDTMIGSISTRISKELIG